MIDVALTRADLRRCDVAVVIDVLRATSVATQALATGYERVLCTESLDQAERLRGAGRVLAGERQCLKPPGFDQGNSPREAAIRCGEDLVLATTNGAPAIVEAARLAPTVMLGCLLNLTAVLAELTSLDPARCHLQLVCAGTDGAVALEDTYLAGRLSAGLAGTRTDAAHVAEAVARAFANPRQALEQSANARVLVRSGMDADIAYCAQESVLDCVPQVVSADDGTAVIARRAQPVSRTAWVDTAATVEA
ncbi:MAG TPA: 2-phosphosulfolactate phosphatase [Solirubrobacteraceae bacterium]